MGEGSPTLEVGFAIDTGGAFEELLRFSQMFDQRTVDIVRQVAQIEKATGGMLQLGPATASMTTFGAAATRELQSVARETARAEKTGEALARQLERQATTFGKTREELRAMKVETAALAAEQQGLTELAGRLRAQEADLYDQEFAAMRKARAEAEALAEEKIMAAQQSVAAAEREAKAVREAAWAYQMFEARVRQGAAALREMEAAEKAAARDQAAQQLRADAAAAAQLATEHARLAAMVRDSHAAQEADAAAAERLRMATDPLYAATQRLNAEIAESTRLYHAGATAPEEYARQQQVLTGRLNEMTGAHDKGAASVARHGHTLTQFTFQLNDVATMAMSGAKPMQIFATQAGQIFQIAQMAEGGVKGFALQLGGLALAYAPVIAAAAVAVGGLALFDRAVSKGVDTKAMVAGLGLTHDEIKRLKDVSVSTGDVVKATFQVMAQRVGINLGDMSKWFSDALDWMTKAGRVALAALYSEFVGTFKAIGVIVKGVFAGKGMGEIMTDVGNSYKDAFDDANKSMIKFGQDVTKQIGSNKLADLRKQAAEIKADRNPKKDGHADQLARDAAAVEAQIRNLYALAAAYDVSGAAALIAEARVKAESQAIKQRADIEAAVARQVRLAIAQRVSDASKGSAGLRDQAAAQALVNAMVADGLAPAARAADLVKDQLADLPLLTAMQAAQQIGDRQAIDAVTAALERQRAARTAANAEAEKAQFNADMAAGSNRLAELWEELRVVGATDAVRVHTLAVLKATQEAEAKYRDPQMQADYIEQQVAIADRQQVLIEKQNAYNDALNFTADRWDLIAGNVQDAAQGMADAFGQVGRAIGDMAAIYSSYEANRTRLETQHAARLKAATGNQASIDRENARFALASATSQVGAFGDMAAAAKGFFGEKSKGYQAAQAAEKAFRAVEFALSVRAMAQDIIETGAKIANSAARTAAGAVEAVVNAIKSLPFPLNLAAGAATVAALASIGVAVGGAFSGGGKNSLTPANTGTGTVLGDSEAKSESIKRAIDALKEVDTVTNSYARDMSASLKSIDSQIGGLASVLIRAGNINASAGVTEGFKTDTTGKILSRLIDPTGLVSKIPIIGGIVGGISSVVKSLFGTKTSVIGSGLFGDAQSLGSILNGGFDASYYSDIQKKKKFFGITTSTKYSTNYSAADPTLENQFTLILRQFNDAIVAAAGPLGNATTDIQNRLNSFVLNIGKIDLQGLTGTEIEEKLTAIFGAAADSMANAAFPGIAQFQQVGEGAFETLVRVASTVEAVTSALDLLGQSAQALGVATKLDLADQFDSVSAMTDAVDAYFQSYYSKEEQSAAKLVQFSRVFDSLGLSMPSTLAAFRQLVEAQDLTTQAGMETYATLLKLAPAFADLQSALTGAKSAADILSERQDLERKILELQGNTAALRELDLAKLDASNRALQQQIYAIEDAKAAAQAAADLAAAWTSVGDSIRDEIDRIRGLAGANADGGFASLMGQFNAATSAARAGDQDAARSLPGLSQALLKAAADTATSRQELDRIQAQTAASLDATYSVITALASGTPSSTGSASILTTAATAAQASTSTAAANDDLISEVRALRNEVVQLRSDNNAGHAANAGNTGRIARRMDDVTAASGGTAISVESAA
jgi:hypothetical protein